MLTSSPQQPRRGGFGGAGGWGCLWAPPSTAPRWGCSERCCRGGWGGGDCPGEGGGLCARVRVREVCVSVCVCKGARGRQISPAVWGGRGVHPTLSARPPPAPGSSSLPGILQDVSCCPVGLGAGRCHWGAAPHVGSSGCSRGLACTLHLAHSLLRLQGVAKWGGRHLVSPLLLLSLGSGRETGHPWLSPGLVSSPTSLRDACVGSWAPPWAAPRAQPHGPPSTGTGGPHGPFAGGGRMLPGWEPGVAGRSGALLCN